MTNRNHKNSTGSQRGQQVLKILRKNIFKQAALAVLTVALAVVLIVSMTAAWFTNVVQSSGLIFEAAQWGFDGTIYTADTVIKAGPGDDGLICLQMTNASDNAVAVSVNVSKEAMDQRMRQRLYFYVDAPMSRNGEIMDRVYISAQEGYTYTVFGQGSLILTEQMHNDAQLKWEWVYDVLGYYVLGTEDSSGNVQVVEYLRPIIYDYDEATVTYETVTTTDTANGQTVQSQVRRISTVDGTTTVEEFLVDLSQRDGYAGQIDPDTRTVRGYYPVDVDENGYGVWAYMCSYSEIEKSMYDDVTLSTMTNADGSPVNYTARLMVSGQMSQVPTTVVGSQRALLDALAAGGNNLIQLSQDVILDSTIEVGSGERVNLDLNGHTLTSQVGSNLGISIDPGGSMTVLNGSFQGSGTSYAVGMEGGELTMSNVSISDVNYGLFIRDHLTDGADSKIRLVNCTIDANSNGILMYSNADDSPRPSQLVVENCSINGENNIGMAFNGTYWGSDIQVINSTVTGYWAGIYMPQAQSDLLISGSDIRGYTGIAVKGGTVRIVDSTVTGTGTAQEPGFSNSGWTDTGDGIYLEGNYACDVLIEISGSSRITSENNQAVRLYTTDDAPGSYEILICGGTYSTDVSAHLAPGAAVTLEDGLYVVTPPAEEDP